MTMSNVPAAHSRDRRADGPVILDVTLPDFVLARAHLRGAKRALVESEPEIYFTTPHFDGHASVLVNLRAVGVTELRELITDSWRNRAPRKLLQEFDGE